MAEKTFAGIFESDTDVIAKIDELNLKGYSDNDMYVIARQNVDTTMIQARTDVDVEKTDGSWWDNFTAFLSGKEPVKDVFSGIGIDVLEAERYLKDLESGSLLLYTESHNHE